MGEDFTAIWRTDLIRVSTPGPGGQTQQPDDLLSQPQSAPVWAGLSSATGQHLVHHQQGESVERTGGGEGGGHGVYHLPGGALVVHDPQVFAELFESLHLNVRDIY